MKGGEERYDGIRERECMGTCDRVEIDQRRGDRKRESKRERERDCDNEITSGLKHAYIFSLTHPLSPTLSLSSSSSSDPPTLSPSLYLVQPSLGSKYSITKHIFAFADEQYLFADGRTTFAW